MLVSRAGGTSSQKSRRSPQSSTPRHANAAAGAAKARSRKSGRAEVQREEDQMNRAGRSRRLPYIREADVRMVAAEPAPSETSCRCRGAMFTNLAVLGCSSISGRDFLGFTAHRRRAGASCLARRRSTHAMIHFEERQSSSSSGRLSSRLKSLASRSPEILLISTDAFSCVRWRRSLLLRAKASMQTSPLDDSFGDPLCAWRGAALR